MHSLMSALFSKLVDLFSTGAEFLLVFDGPDRPDLKRKTKVTTTSAEYRNHCESFTVMAAAFGMTTRIARGEAEAELAALNKDGSIDSVLSVMAPSQADQV